ncbi:Glyoxalase/Bleomycin resistance protein/Dioxygenase superfamily protein [Novosphingobium sp. CF614]|uniref:VOC family protein n=1 Tax=Novosphingobium sp. CF614 TaxID=1884364 RepID=UPI0008F28B98|nr:VOC family protein [Novosphingobium sp. CF614]SFG42728.1 Glyoxalase/Bleomycin resistance protein/Dioxygenase superfamily protein [Novosphingobium sp. CF614]
MAITGIRRLVFRVEDLDTACRFFEDYGLYSRERDDTAALFETMDGGEVHLLKSGHSGLPAHTEQTGTGVFECVWAVDGERAMRRLCADLARDHELTTDKEGTVHFVTPFGQAIGLEVWQPRTVHGAPSPSNTVGKVGRLNQPRKWIDRAVPKRIHHCVWTFPDVQEAIDYYRDRLGFRVTDLQKGFGVYMRADGAFEHHNIFLANAHAGMPNFDGTLRFHHCNFELEDIDEVMVAKNYLDRKGWKNNGWGLGRHRLTSAAFLYTDTVAFLGGEMEYGADCDVIDDSWKPRVWDGPFGTAIFMHELPAWMQDYPNWDVTFARDDQLRYLPAAPKSAPETSAEPAA